ncbi:MAG: hypothetical protein HQK87_06145, partial [Nitrospinae bacterium]|nr:hypothetical protein [Nitrospinota bacterium]
MARMKQGLLTTLLVSLALLASACSSSSSGSSSTAADLTNRIYIVAADSGSADGSGTTYTVTLTGVDPGVDWYEDRPARTTGDETADAFFGTSWSSVYAGGAPNALLQYTNDTGLHALFGAVSDPAYDAATGTATFTLTLAKATYDISGGVGAFTAPVLTLLNNVTPPDEGSSFALYGATAVIEDDGAGGYRLTVTGIDAKVFWMNNGPARQGDFETPPTFAAYWDERFGDAAPNGSLAGDIGDGTYEVQLMTLSSPTFDEATSTLTFVVTPLADAGAPAVGTSFTEAVLFVDAGPRSTPSTVFSQMWRGIAYSAIPAKFNNAPTGHFFDSDMTADNFQSIWGSKDGCGRNDLATMAANGVNLVRLYDYNYVRGASAYGQVGYGHIAFLDKAQALGIKVIIPISNWNFSNDRYAWENIQTTVANIVASVKKNGAIHPAVHSFSVGNELDLNKYNLNLNTLIPRAVQVAEQIHRLAPDHYITIPVSTAYEGRMYAMFMNGEGSVPALSADLYNNRFYNSVQTFKVGDDLKNNILASYERGGWGV